MPIGNVSVLLSLNSNGFTRGLNNANRQMQSFGQRVTGMVGSFLKLTGAAAAAGAAISAALNITKKFGEIDALGKTADKLGISVEALQGFRYAAQQSGVEIRALETGLQRMVRRVQEAGRGTGEAVNAIKDLGLNAKGLAALGPEAQFLVLADAFKRVEDQSERVRLAFKLFDTEGVAFVNILREGSDGLVKMGDSLGAMGGVLDREGVAKVEKFNQALTDLKAQWSTLADTLISTVAPALTFILKQMNDMIRAARIFAYEFTHAFGLNLFDNPRAPKFRKVDRPITAPTQVERRIASVGPIAQIGSIGTLAANLIFRIGQDMGQKISEMASNVTQTVQKQIPELIFGTRGDQTVGAALKGSQEAASAINRDRASIAKDHLQVAQRQLNLLQRILQEERAQAQNLQVTGL